MVLKLQLNMNFNRVLQNVPVDLEQILVNILRAETICYQNGSYLIPSWSYFDLNNWCFRKLRSL